MSLDVYLVGEAETVECTCCNCDNRHTYSRKREYYSANITHNLAHMAEAAGLYAAMWRPDEQGWKKAAQIIEPLAAGIAKLESDPERFRKMNPANGWGSYEGLLKAARDYLVACREFPDADIKIWR